MVGFLGCLYAGTLAVPAYPPGSRRNLPRLRAIAGDARPAVALTAATHLDRLRSLAAQAPELDGVEWLTTDVADPDTAAGWTAARARPETPAFLQYTSGSTATPKGVVVSHGNLIHNQEVIRRACGQTRESIVVGWLPPYHDMGLIGNLLHPLYLGIPCVLMPPMAFLQRPVRWLEAISRYRATTSCGPNFAYELCVRRIPEDQRAGLDLRSWRFALCGAEPVRARTLERFARAFAPCGFDYRAFYPCYGLAEATLFVSGKDPEGAPRVLAVDERALERGRVAAAEPETPGRELVSCGRPGRDLRLEVVDPETATACADGRVGEVWLAGPSVARGYWNRPEETEAVFGARLAGAAAGPFLRTGDLGFVRDGELFVTGRIKDLIIIRGRNLYPQDVEWTAERSHPALRSAGGAAFSVDAEGEERLVVVHEIERRREAEAREAAEAVRRAVAEDHGVQAYRVVLIRAATLPRTSSGKVRRGACRAAFLAGELTTVAGGVLEVAAEADTRARPGLDLEAVLGLEPDDRLEVVVPWLRARIARVARVPVESVDPGAPLASLGLDSLMAVELKHALETELGVALELPALLASPSVVALAADLLGRPAAGRRAAPAAAEAASDVAPLSYGQRGLWFLQRMVPESAFYNIAMAARVDGELDPAALRRAFETLVERHPALRTTFEEAAGEPRQRIHPRMALDFRVEDATGWGAAELRQRLAESGYRGFDLERGPLLRVRVFARAGRPPVVLLAAHHIIADFWSMAILVREMGALVERGAAASLEPLALRYVDYVAWQRARVAGAEGERLLAYWRERLAGELPVLDLPTDRPRPAVESHRGATRSLRLGRGLSAALKTLARRHDATLYTTLLTGFQVLLHRYTGQEDVLVGSPTTGRGAAELRSLVGYFANPVAVRGDLSGKPTFGELLGRLRATVLEAFEHQDYPFPLLVEKLRLARDASRAPVFHVLFGFQRAHRPGEEALAAFALRESGARLALGSLVLESVGLARRQAQYDLTLIMAEVDGRLAASLEYSTDLFDATTIGRLLGHFETLLASAVADPDRRVASLGMLTAAERLQLVREWNHTRRPDAGRETIHELAAVWAERTPDAVALCFEDVSLTYGALERAAGGLARRLRRAGVAPEVRVGILLERSAEMVVALLAVLRAGGAYVALDPSLPRERLAAMLADHPLPVLLTAARLGAGLEHAAERVLRLDDRGPAAAGEDPAPIRVAGANLAYAIYTSGSTGKPKLVGVEHRQIANYVRGILARLALPSGASYATVSTLAADLGNTVVFAALATGGRLHVIAETRAKSAEAFADYFATRRIDCLKIVPSHLQALQAADGPGGLPRRRLILGGEASTWDEVAALRRRAPGCRVFNHYGPTETTVGVATYRVTGAPDPPRGATVPLGRPLPGAELHLLDGENRPVPIGVPGELYIGGAGVSRGYLGAPGQTAAAFLPDPWSGRAGARLYRSGDRARRLPDGSLEFLGRGDGQVKFHGYRVELGEVSAALDAHPKVRRSVVRLYRDRRGQQAMVAYYVARRELPVGELRRRLGRRLPPEVIPNLFVHLRRLPLTLNGKVNLEALPAPDAIRSAREETGELGTIGLTEELLAEFWSEILGVPAVAIDDNFFELGGHSLLAIRLSSRIRQVFRIELPLREIFEAPSVRQLARRVDAGRRIDRDLPLEVWARRPGEALPLSVSQERLWFLDRFEPGNAAFLMPGSVRLRGALDVAALKAAVRGVVRRHESLRTTFSEVDGRPVQRIASSVALELPLIDLAGLSLPDARRESERWQNREARLPFDLGTGPLLRARLLRLSAADHEFVLTMHHIVSDGWSVGILIRELAALYGAVVQGRRSPLEPLPLQYADFARWQRQWLESGVLDAQLAYWRGQLAGAPPTLELPTDRPRPAVQTFSGGRTETVLAPALQGELRALSRRFGVTLFITLLAAFKILLHRLSGQDDVLVGTPIAGRGRQEIEGLIGFFLNTLVVRTDFAKLGRLGFRELVERTRETALDAYSHQDVPFERLLQELQPERTLSHTPLFQVFFNMRNLRIDDVELPGLRLSPVTHPEIPSKFDLTIYVDDRAEGVALHLVYNSDLFAPARMAEMLRQFEGLLRQVVEDPERPIDRLSLVTAEAAAVLPEPRARLDDAFLGTVPEVFARRARECPDRVAVVDPDGSWSYGRLRAASARLARRLRAAGVSRGDRVVIYGHRSAPLVPAILGTLEAGAAFVILDPAYPAARLAEMVARAAPRALIALGAAGAPPSELEDAVAALPGCRRLALPGRPAARRGDATGPGVALGKDDLAYVAFTSGSSGVPKGILGRHGSLTHFLPWQRETFRLGAADRFSLLSGLAHDPLHRDVFTPLQLGACVSIPDPDDLCYPRRLASWLRRERITVAHLTPAMGQLLAESTAGEPAAGVTTPALRYAFLVGDVLSRRDVARLRRLAPAVRCVNFFGTTETQRAVGYYVATDPDGAASGSEILPLGRGIEDVQLLVLDPAGGLAGVGELGEICVRSPHLALGYLGDPALTARRFAAHPSAADAGERIYRTGDLGRYLPDGNVVFVSRADQQVQIRGFRVELGEIEAVLGRHPAILEAAVLARDERPGDRRLVAYVVPAAGGEASEPPATLPRALERELRGFLARRLPGYMVPSALVALAALPLTPNGKIDRAALRRLAPADRPSVEERVAPRGALEETLAAIWREVLRRDEIGGDDDFFALGGHSLLAIRMVSRVRETWGVELPLRTVFEAPTLTALAARLAALQRADRALSVPPLEASPRRGPVVLSFAQERLWFLYQLEPHSPFYNLSSAVRLVGRLDVDLLRRSLGAIVERHETLRTSFGEIDGEPRQRISSRVSLDVPIVDATSLRAPDRETLARALAAREARRSFGLDRPPLMRVLLLRLGPAESVLLLTLHHIVSDGWSAGIAVRELAAHYTALRDGRPASLEPLEIQYADYAVWQRRWLTGEILERQQDYWRRQLAGLPTLELPTDRPRPPFQTYRGRRVAFRLSERLSNEVRALGRERGATLYMTLLAAFQSLLARLGGQHDLAVGSPNDNRIDRSLEGLIGLFVNMLVLRTNLAGDPTFVDALRRVRETAVGAYGHQDLPFEQVVETLRPPRDLSRNPLFQVMFNLINAPFERLDLAALELRPLAVEGSAARFDLALTVVDGPVLEGTWEYSTDLYDEVTIRRLVSGFERLLASVTDDPGRKLSELTLLSSPQRQQLLREWNDTATPPVSRRLLPELLADRAATMPEATAVVCGERWLSYGELADRGRRLARHLAGLGIGPEDRVGLFVERSPVLPVALWGVLEAGAAYVPLDPASPATRLVWTLEDSGATVLLTHGRLEGGWPAAIEVPRIELDETGAPVTASDRASDPTPAPVSAHSLAYVIYTSGSTGHPKGVQISHGALRNFLFAMAREPGFAAEDVLLAVTALSFDIAGLELFLPLLRGGRVVIAEREDVSDAIRLGTLAARSRATVLQATPAAWRLLTAAGWRGGPRALCGGEALTADLAAELGERAPEVWNLYGPTETTVWSTVWRVRDGVPVSIGRPIANTETYLLDRRLRPVMSGAVGELAIGGTGLARGYLGRPALSAERFVPDFLSGRDGDRLYLTGDLARFRSDGLMECLGRRDHQVKIRGFRIELGEIEETLALHPEVGQAAALARAEETPGAAAAPAADARLVAYVVPRDGNVPGPAALRGFLKERLPLYMVPAAFVVLESLPLTPNGKVDRGRLPAPQEDARQAGAAYRAPRNELERSLASVFEDILRLGQVGVDDNFFDLGGTSAHLLQVRSRLQKTLTRELKIVDLFKYPTVGALAAFLRTDEPAVPAAAEPDGDVRSKRLRLRRRRQRLQRARG